MLYKEVLGAFNECKDKSLTLVLLIKIQHVFGFKKNICFKGKSIFFQVVLKVANYKLKTILNEDGFKTINDNRDTWHPLTNFLGDYKIVRIAKDAPFEDRFHKPTC